VKCEYLMDKHVGAFETSDGRIQDINCEGVIRQCFSCSNKVQSTFFVIFTCSWACFVCYHCRE